ncbi:hypothetical protein Shyd_47390 [Streptomyces hydrogenans]|uniref:Uncharacterized protein n=1 Tax=Streptomyces hydrogenans TaxID=1873719 RepID=A0ABQ3PEB2_9ACTN|nr:hypothetical protein Shyd_47390 [Streptomyces hydrogenans]
MRLHWAWYALAILAGVYRMIAVCFEAVVRQTIAPARQPAAEPPFHPVRKAPCRHASGSRLSNRPRCKGRSERGRPSR